MNKLRQEYNREVVISCVMDIFMFIICITKLFIPDLLCPWSTLFLFFLFFSASIASSKMNLLYKMVDWRKDD